MIGKQIKKARLLAGLKQKQLGDLLGGKGVSTISEWESGKRSPDVELLPELSRVLNVSQAFLLDLTDDPHYINKDQSEIVPMNEEDIAIVMKYRAAKDEIKTAVRKLLDIE